MISCEGCDRKIFKKYVVKLGKKRYCKRCADEVSSLWPIK